MTNSVHSQTNESLAAHGGGDATAAGVDFQARLGAWLCSHLVADRRLGIGLGGRRLSTLHFESEAPVDDILAQTEAGWLFIQAKTNLRLEKSASSELAKVAGQVVRQWLICHSRTDGPTWNRPLQTGEDLFVLAIGPNASRTISSDLAKGIDAFNDSTADPILNAKQQKAISAFSKHLAHAWYAEEGESATQEDIRSILGLTKIVSLDLHGANLTEAEEILGRVLETRDDARATFPLLLSFCQTLMANRSSCDVTAIKQYLRTSGIRLKAAPAYQSDVEKLRIYSQRTREILSSHEAIDIASTPVRIDRQCTSAVIAAARMGSVVVIGEPGAGKSAVISVTAETLSSEGHEVVALSVDRLPVSSLGDLSREIGLEHGLREVLLNWQGDQPNYLIIDALDASRGGQSEAVFRALMSELRACAPDQWRVIASIRSFDLRMGLQFQELFEGSPPRPEFSDSAFSNIVHVNVPTWTSDELTSLLQEAPSLASEIDSAGERIRDLALIPFNTKLMADLIGSGLDPSNFSAVQNQAQLLDLYWDKRIAHHGSTAEVCLAKFVSHMVDVKSLQVTKLAVLDATSDGAALDTMLEANVLVEATPRYIAFRHHILFDYTASRVYLPADNPSKIMEILKRDKGLGLILSPALSFTLMDIWNEGDRSAFWATILRLTGNPTFDPIAASIAARMACELPQFDNDIVGLSARGSTEVQGEEDRVRSLSRIIGALVVRLEEDESVALDPWCALAQQLSTSLTSRTVGCLRVLLFALYERVNTRKQTDSVGYVSRRFFEFAFMSIGSQLDVTSPAIQFVAATYNSDPSESKRLLRMIFEPHRFSDHGEKDLFTLAQGLNFINEEDPGFLTEIYIQAFGNRIFDDSVTPIGSSQILSLLSNRRQDYDVALYSFKEFFSKFLETHPQHAIKALCSIIEDYVENNERPIKKGHVWNIAHTDHDAKLQQDLSHVWGWNIGESSGDNTKDLINIFVQYIRECQPEYLSSVIACVIENNKMAVLWAHLFRGCVVRAPDTLGLLWHIATQEPFLLSLDTRKFTIDFIAARYPFEPFEARLAFEQRALAYTFDEFDGEHPIRDAILSELFSCAGQENIATEAARTLIRDVTAGIPSGGGAKKPFEVVTTLSKVDEWGWLRAAGVNVDEPDISTLLEDVRGLEDSLQGTESPGLAASLFDQRDLLTGIVDRIESGKLDCPASLTEYAYSTVGRFIKVKLWSQHTVKARMTEKDVSWITSLVTKLNEYPSPELTDEEERNFEEQPRWNSTDVSVQGAETLLALGGLDSRTALASFSLLKTLSQAKNPAIRFVVAQNMYRLQSTNAEGMWQLAELFARQERNCAILEVFVDQFMRKEMFEFDMEATEQLLFCLLDRSFTGEETRTIELRGKLAVAVSNAAFQYERDQLRGILLNWIADPISFSVELGQVFFTHREGIVLKYCSADNEAQNLSARVQRFYNQASASIQDHLLKLFDDTGDKQPTESEQSDFTTLLKLLNDLNDQIYFASGAFKSQEDKFEPLERDISKAQFIVDMEPTLERVADVGAPRSIYHFIALLEYLISGHPATVFDLVSRALMGGGRKHGFQMESMGADSFVRIIGRYLADYRYVFDDEDRRRCLSDCLELFADVGWRDARALLYRLPDLLK